MSAGNAKVELKIDMSGFTAAMGRLTDALAAVLDDPLLKVTRTLVAAMERGERPCGRDHSTGTRCDACRAEL